MYTQMGLGGTLELSSFVCSLKVESVFHQTENIPVHLNAKQSKCCLGADISKFNVFGVLHIFVQLRGSIRNFSNYFIYIFLWY